MSILRCGLMLLLIFAADKESLTGSGPDERARTRRFYCHCNVLAAVLYLFFFYLPVVSRIGYYLTVTQIFYVPMLIRGLPAGWKRRAAAAVAVLFCLVFFVHTMRHAGDNGFRILPYETCLFHEMPAILSETGY